MREACLRVVVARFLVATIQWLTKGKGVGPALIQGPMSRFGDTAANAGMLSFLDASENTRNLPTSVKTAMASGAAALWRINLMPVDTCKTIMQVEGVKGLPMLRNKIKVNGMAIPCSCCRRLPAKDSNAMLESGIH